MQQKLEVIKQLKQDGYIHIRYDSQAVLQHILAHSDILHYAEISPDRRKKSLSNSSKPLELHTDHHLAEYIILHAVQPATIGGKNMLADMRASFTALSLDDQEILRTSLFSRA